MSQEKNILLNQFREESIHELVPAFSNGLDDVKFLSFNNDIQWSSIKGSTNLIITKDASGDIILDVSLNAFEDTEMYFRDGQIGVGRLPLYEYKVDIAVPVDTRMTALHIGDGVSGFSLGNATDEGFLPQIIGIGSDENDAGLYFLGKTILDVSSNTPLIVFDGRDINNNPLQNRPILGISSGSYTDFKVLIDQHGNVTINGEVKVNSVLAKDSSNNYVDLLQLLEDLKTRIEILEQT